MIRFILKRVLLMIPVLFIIATMTFFMMHLAPGGPFDAAKRPSKEVLEHMQAYYGLDKPLFQQYLTEMGHLLRGDLGPSYKYINHSVNEIIADAFPVSLELGLEALLVALLLGLPVGLLAAWKKNSALDYVPMSLTTLGICVPTFVVGPLLISIFALHLDWFNAAGWFFPRDRVLPAITLGTYYAAYLARLMRGGMLEVLNQDFIRTARAKGASSKRILVHHALRGGILPVVSFLGPAAAGLLTGSFVVETIFGIPGLGRYFVTAASNRDYCLVMGAVLFYAAFISVLNLAVDVALVWLNPKLRFE